MMCGAQELLPRHVELIKEIDRRFIAEARERISANISGYPLNTRKFLL